MQLRKKTKNKNPYFTAFFTLAIICILTLCSVFFIINSLNIHRLQDNYYREKLQLITEDYSRQLDIFENIQLKISISGKYEPQYICTNKYHEVLLLEDFSQYRTYSVLTDVFFLSYQGQRIYASSGSVYNLEYRFTELSQEHFELLYDALSDCSTEQEILSLGNSIFLIYPLKGAYQESARTPKLCFVVDKNALANRFFTVSGISDMMLSIHYNNNLIYASHEESPQKNIFTAQTEDGFLFSLSPLDNGFFSSNTLLPLQILLIGINLILILITTHYLAAHAYLPLKKLSQNYRQKVSAPPIEVQYENALDELKHLMDTMIQDNISLNQNTLQKQKQLHRQILHTLLFNNFALADFASLDTLQLELPGPLYYVVSISFIREANITNDILNDLQERMETLTDKQRREYIYGVCNYTQKQLILICSIAFKEQNQHLTDRILLMLEEDSMNPTIGVGEIHDSLSRISASWLESTEMIHKQSVSKKATNATYTEHSFKINDFSVVIHGLTEGNEENALEEFHTYMKRFQNNNVSFLMQQYEFSNIISKLSKLANRANIEISDTSISLLISARTAQEFQTAVDTWIHEFCQQQQLIQEQIAQNENFRIFEYINHHFTDSNLSIEEVASTLSTTAATVRQAVLAQTGMMYRDYVIYLRIEYAKELLIKENLSNNEVCQKVGYYNVSHFTQLFKKHTGTTPAHYKKNPTA